MSLIKILNLEVSKSSADVSVQYGRSATASVVKLCLDLLYQKESSRLLEEYSSLIGAFNVKKAILNLKLVPVQ